MRGVLREVPCPLAAAVEEDDSLLALASAARPPRPNLFLAAVYYLLLSGSDEILLGLFLRPDDPANLISRFRRFCVSNGKRLRRVVAARIFQVNEVRRSALIFLSLCFLKSRLQERPVALIEVGASAGLNLLWDHYGYQFGNLSPIGPCRVPFRISCPLRDGCALPLAVHPPRIVSRLGIDLNPLSLESADDVRWLRSVLLAKSRRKGSTVDGGNRLCSRKAPRILRGDAVDLLLQQVCCADSSSIPCVVHTFVREQFTEERWIALDTILRKASANRRVYRLSVEGTGNEPPSAAAIELHRTSTVADERSSWDSRQDTCGGLICAFDDLSRKERLTLWVNGSSAQTGPCLMSQKLI